MMKGAWLFNEKKKEKNECRKNEKNNSDVTMRVKLKYVNV